MNRLKKYIVVPLCACIFLSAGCNNEEEADPALTAVTDENGEAVTDANGNPVPAFTDAEGNIFAAITDENGAPVTDSAGNMLPDIPEEETVYKVGFIYNLPVSEGGNAKIFENARMQLEKSLDIETCYVENVLVSEIPNAVYALQESGCNIIVSCSSRYDNSIVKEAKSSPETFFINFGGSSNAFNMSSVGGELYQTACVCGIVGAYNTQTNVLGIVADPGAYNACGILDAYVLGVKEIWTQADVRLNWAWSKDKAKTREAIDDLAAQGADVLMCYMETDYAAQYAASIGLKVIASSCDLPELIPDNYLTGFYFNISTFLVDAVRSICAECFVSTVSEGGISAGTARLIDFSENCREGTDAIGSKLYDYIKSGKAQVFTGEIKSRGNQVMVEKGEQLAFSGIRGIEWLVQGITEVGNFTTVTEELSPTEMIVRE